MLEVLLHGLQKNNVAHWSKLVCAAPTDTRRMPLTEGGAGAAEAESLPAHGRARWILRRRPGQVA
jgi:hypothetical protein